MRKTFSDGKRKRERMGKNSYLYFLPRPVRKERGEREGEKER